MNNKHTISRDFRALAMAIFVMLAGILFNLQRDWSSFLARLWKSISFGGNEKIEGTVFDELIE